MAAILDSVTINGVDVPMIYEEDNHLPIVSMQVVFQNSGAISSGPLAGLAKFASKMMNEGTKDLGATGFAKLLEERAITLGAHSGTETFVFELGSLKESFGFGTQMLAKLLTQPNLQPEAFEKVRQISMGQLMRKESDYDYQAAVLLKRLLFADTPLAAPSEGNVTSLKQIKLKDVSAFLELHLVLGRAIVVVGGDLTLQEAKGAAQTALAPLKKGAFEPLDSYPASKEEKIETLHKPTEQAYIYFGSPYVLENQEARPLAKVAAFILGSSGFGSRLMEEVRVKRGLAYSAYGRIVLNRTAAYFSGHLQTKLQSQEEAIKVVRDVIAEFVAKGVTQKELDAAKQFLLGSEPLRNELLSQRTGRAFDEYYKGLGLGYSRKELARIESIGLDELNRYIAAHKELLDLSFAIVTQE